MRFCGAAVDGSAAAGAASAGRLLGESEQGWEDATRQVVAEATKTLHGVTSVYVKEFQATVENDKVKNFRVDAKVSFRIERK
jgi:dodecin